MAILDNSTRWNSTYKSLKRGLQLKARIQLFCFEQRANIGNDMLGEEDWDHLEEVMEGLKPFHQATIRVEGLAGRGHHGAVWEVLPTLEALLQEMERRQAALINEGRGGQPLAVAYQNAWEKLNKYYNLTDVCHEIYAAAVLFHPSYRKGYFDRKWNSKEMNKYKELMLETTRHIWEAQYQSQEVESTNKKDEDELDFLDRYLAVEDQSNDQFAAYINAQGVVFPNNQPVDLIDWWMNDRQYPQLRQYALDLLSIPAMSAEVERVFSSAKRLIGPDRMRLNDDTIEYLELLKYWWSKGIITQQPK
jgi:hypothetical protein